MRALAGGLIAFLGLLVLGLKVVCMCLAWLILTINEWLEALSIWLNRHAARIGGFKLPVRDEPDEDAPELDVPAESNLDFHNKHCICWRCVGARTKAEHEKREG